VTISGNSAENSSGGMYNSSSSLVLTSVTISGNSVENSSGGGMYNESSSLVLINVTISGNSAGVRGGGMFNSSSSSLAVRNSLIWGNKAPSNPNMDNTSSTPVFACSIVEGSFTAGSWDGSAGNEEVPLSNQDTDPLFLDWQDPGAVTMPNSNGDYRPKDGSGGAEGTVLSPAINGGNSGFYPASAEDPVFGAVTLSETAKALINEALGRDLAGNTRIQGLSIDMGAYERR
jgi:hypothetical protein